MGRAKRARAAIRAERHAAELAKRLGKALKDARTATRLKQAQAAAAAGISQSAWSQLESAGDPRFTIATWDRAAFAVGATLDAFLRRATAADQPKDAVHLRGQELIIRTALAGAWRALPEEPIDREARTSRFADVLLYRRPPGPRELTPAEYALMEVIDWFEDVGDPIRDWGRRLEALERYAISRMIGDDPLPRTGGCWVVRATQRNRRLIAQHRNFFRARFPGSGLAWIESLTNPQAQIPKEPALLWVSVSGDRLFAARLGSG
jgi:transcriptional regulator with XRE-family HTH domain